MFLSSVFWKDYFDISFEADGVSNEGHVWRCKDHEEFYFQVSYREKNLSQAAKMIVLKYLPDGAWIQLHEHPAEKFSSVFLEAIIMEIQNHLI